MGVFSLKVKKQIPSIYPDFIWDDGSLHITQTQKETARAHRIPDALLAKLWEKE